MRLRLLERLHVQVAVVVFTALDILGVVALERVHVEDGAEAAAVRPGLSFDADVKLAAVRGVRVAREHSGLLHVGGVGADEPFGDFALVAAVHQVGPDAHALVVVVRESRRALVPRALAVPAGEEDAAVVGVGEDAVQPRAVGGADRWLQVRAVATVDGERIGAVFPQWINIIEHESVAARLEACGAIAAGVVLVAAFVVGVEAELVRTLEVVALLTSRVGG